MKDNVRKQYSQQKMKVMPHNNSRGSMDPERRVLKESIQINRRQRKICTVWYLILLDIKKMQIKSQDTSMNQLEWQKLRGLTILSVDKDMEWLELSYTTDDNIKCYYHLGKLEVS